MSFEVFFQGFIGEESTSDEGLLEERQDFLRIIAGRGE
jgi:hypothetical protein